MSMRLTATDFYSYYRPSKCGLRVFLREQGEPESPAGPYEEFIRRLGLEHERKHLESLGPFVDLRAGTTEERARRTRKEVANGSPVIYQPVLRASATLNGTNCEVHGEPDFLIKDPGGYSIRDSKVSRRINERDHPKILRQLELYGWLYERNFGEPPTALHVHSGSGEIVNVPYDGGEAALAVLREIVNFQSAASVPYSPVGWTKCGGCGFRERCWSAAEQSRDVALVDGVDQGLAVSLREQGITTIDELLGGFDEEELSNLTRHWGTRNQRVGSKASAILTMARALASGEELLLKTPDLPDCSHYVMFDLEGLPPQLDELDKVFLWGLQVFGNRPSEFKYALAGLGADGDRVGWESFLSEASNILNHYGDIPFVHWHHYERVRLDVYVDRYGDRDGVAKRVRDNLLDLLPVTKQSIALPLSSYSLKVVEKHIGFARTQTEYGGDWAMAK